jgi:transcription elongation factor Elf1
MKLLLTYTCPHCGHQNPPDAVLGYGAETYILCENPDCGQEFRGKPEAQVVRLK